MSVVSKNDYVHNCMEMPSCTLGQETPPESDNAATYTFMIRETLTLHVKVDAESFEMAQQEVERLYNDGEYDLDHNCFAGVEFRPCCSCCGSDFDDDYDLREVDDGTPKAKIICDRCMSMNDNTEHKRLVLYEQ